MDDPTISLTGAPQEPDGNLRSWGTFRILEKLGQGAFGEVYRAWDPTLEREVALKILRPTGKGDDYRSVVREARAVAKIRHPNIVSVYGVDRHDGRVGFWSEFVHGKTLSALLESQGPFSPTEATLIGMELCRAVSAVHAAGMLHRDIKASNAMREEGGHIRLLDFGLSHEHDAEASWGGTAQYMAPELIAGNAASAASDIYALGVLLYHLATCGYPLARDASTSSSGLLDRRADLPQAFVHMVEIAIDKDPRKRYQSAGAMLQALSGTMGSSEPLTKKVGISKKWLMIVAGGLTAIGAAAYVSKDWIDARLHGTSSTAVYELYLQGQELLVRYDKPGNTERAVTVFTDATKKDPGFALAWAGLGRAYWREYLSNADASMVPRALEACEKALDINPGLAPVQAAIGMIHSATGKTDLGMEELEKAEKLNGNNAEVQAALSSAYQRARDITRAKAAMQKAIDLAPTDWRWPYLMASLNLESGEFKPAEEQANAALAITPDNGLAYYNLGAAYLREGRYREAEGALQKSVEYTPTYRPLIALGNVFTWEAKYEQAAQTIERALQITSTDYRAWANLAVAYAWNPVTRDKAQAARLRAISLAEEVRKITPNDPRLIATLADYYADSNLGNKSLPLLREAIALAPDNPDILFFAAEGYETLGRRKEAIQFVAKSLQLGYSADAIKRTPGMAELRKDKNAPEAIRIH